MSPKARFDISPFESHNEPEIAVRHSLSDFYAMNLDKDRKFSNL